MSADEIIAGDLAIFTPIDPHLHGSSGDGNDASALSSQDIKAFAQMSESWFGVDADEARMQSLSLLCNSIFPPTLTAFYRSTLELQKIGEELISYQLPTVSKEQQQAIVHKLMSGYYSHGYSITREEMTELGLNIVTHYEVESPAWRISQHIQQTVGGALRSHAEQPWCDVLIATNETLISRERRSDGLMPTWHTGLCV